MKLLRTELLVVEPRLPCTLAYVTRTAHVLTQTDILPYSQMLSNRFIQVMLLLYRK